MSNDGLVCEETFEQPVIVRQPIFDREKSIWGYELISNDISGAITGSADPLSSWVDTHIQVMSSLGAELVSNKKLFLNIDREDYLEHTELPEGVDHCVFGLCGDAAESGVCSGFADSLHQSGGCVALDCDMEPLTFNKLIGQCDILKVSLAGKTPAEIVKIRKKYKDFSGKLLATDICNWEAFEGTRALGFKYFQGPFFSVPQLKNDAVLSSSSIAKLQLIKELNKPDSEMDELAGIIASDVSLSYRILKYINSASFGLPNEIKSIQQAVSLIGLKELKHWAIVVVMTDLDSSPKGEELSYMALQRARFLSSLAESISGFSHSPETMFMLGLFSKLDALLSYPMDKALEGIPMDDDVKKGLCGVLNEYRDWLRMLEAIEIGNWAIANDVLGRYGACFTDAATHYMKAATWAAKQLPDMKK